MPTRLPIAVLLLAAPLALGAQAPPGLLIRHGAVVDGATAPPRAADLRIAGDTIVELCASGIEEGPDAATQVRQGIFVPETIAERGTPVAPSRPPAGVRAVIVNGQGVLDAAESTGARPGRVPREARP
jgi:N-acyl-D-aspartate/D-glutamate deacylase